MYRPSFLLYVCLYVYVVIQPLAAKPNKSINQTASRSVQPFSYGSKCYAVQCTVNGEENPKIAPFLWNFITTLEEDQAMAIGNIHKNW